jgi:crotonobetainyl-CoA:carnitine CoA-transferase CaiB-like acyl-CoA transferase
MVQPKIGEEAAAFLMMNRNKRGIVLDLKTEGGKKIGSSLLLMCWWRISHRE